MITSNETTNLKGSLPSNNEQRPSGIGSSNSPRPGPQNPPSYGSYEAQSYPVVQPYPIAQEYSIVVYQESPGLRFCRALTVAFMIWLLFSVFIQSFVALVNWNHKGWGDQGPSGRYPVPENMNLDDCVSNDDWVSLPPTITHDLPKGNPYHPPAGFPYSSQVTFDLPVSSEALLLFSRGSTSAGSVDIVTSKEQPHDVATVRVVVNYFRDDIRDEAKVCRISRQEGETGVGIFTPEWRRGHRGVEETLYFETTVVLPESSSSLVPLVIKKFETDVPNTLQRVHDLGKKVWFRHIFLKGTNAPIEVKSLGMEYGQITGSNGPIQGMFNTSNTLILTTSNAPIRADVGLENDAEGSNPKVVLHTSNSPIESNISLLSSKGSGGVFDVSASTSNGRLHVNFPAAPVDSTLRFTGRTSNAPATALLNPAYEGRFSLQTSRLGAVVNEHKGVEDPSGKKRKRIVQSTRRGGALLGSVYWADDAGALKSQGEVILITSNARVALDL
ncbi:hypothetical protein B0H34DRAFT_747387 [Crassisporium funariophilum]|nr:hypothetical protein B0H34DRAFT_747387 [Crassisporium funariophilum]